jgi:hypothetical protein
MPMPIKGKNAMPEILGFLHLLIIFQYHIRENQSTTGIKALTVVDTGMPMPSASNAQLCKLVSTKLF